MHSNSCVLRRHWFRWVGFGALLGAWLLLTAAQATAAQQTGSIVGTVTSPDGAPLADVAVFIQGAGRSAVSNTQGRFLLPSLEPGAYLLVTERLGLEPARQTVAVRAGEATEVRFELTQTALNLAGVTVIGTREARDLTTTPASIGVIGRSVIDEARPTHPSELMGRVPGVWVAVTGGEGHMAAIRQPLTTEAVYLYLEDGIPTRSTGFFNHNALYEVNLPQADRVEVMKGPGNALYGSDAIGGVVDVQTRAPTERTAGEISAETGEYGFARFLGSLSGSLGSNGLRLDANYTRTDGWRDGTDYDRASANLRWDRPLPGGWLLKSHVAYAAIDQNTAGSSALNREDFENDPTVNYTPISWRQVDALRISAAFDKQAPTWSASVTPFFRYNAMDMLPNWALTFDPAIWYSENTSLGLLAKYHRNVTPGLRLIAGLDADLSPGTEQERAIDPTREGSIFTGYTEGELTYDYDVRFHQVSPYVHAEWAATPALQLQGGLRADFLGYDYTNHLSDTQEGRHRRPADASPTYQALSPKVGATYRFAREANVFLSYRRGFRVPSQRQLFRQGSASNTVDLEPVKADSYEGGVRGLLGSRLSYDVSLYWMDKTDDILNFRLPDGNTQTVNAGKTRHKGVEVGLGVMVLQDLRLDVAYSYAEHVYVSWMPDSEVDYSGNEQEFAPNVMAQTTLTYSPRWLTGSNGALEWRRIGPYWEDASNEHEYEGYDIVSLRLAVPVVAGVSVFGRVHNLLDETYAERASWNGFRGEELAPGLPRTFYLGIEVDR